jgi:hypothetical protein
MRKFSNSPKLSGLRSTILMFDLYVRAFFPVPGDPRKIVAEIRALEGLGRSVGTKPAEAFKHPPLRGLWKKHYLVGGMGSLGANIQIGFGRKQKELRRIVAQHWNPKTAHLPPEVVSRNIADAVVGLYAERSRADGLTGEWIVYALPSTMKGTRPFSTGSEMAVSVSSHFCSQSWGCVRRQAGDNA